MEFKEFPKIPRLSRDCVITEKIDGTNGVIYISEDLKTIIPGSRSRWLLNGQDNAGFTLWVFTNQNDLLKLGPGYHYGEWWGQRIQRNYGLKEKRFSLFNVHKWSNPEIRPKCCYVVPVLFEGNFDTNLIEKTLTNLAIKGSFASPGFMRPEGIVIYHKAGNLLFKKTIEKDDEPKTIKKDS